MDDAERVVVVVGLLALERLARVVSVALLAVARVAVARQLMALIPVQAA